jgi:hydrogenase nickel incorporation protein HypA/HybF
MHELSIALSILDAVADQAIRRGSRVSVVHVKIGPLSGVAPATLGTAFESAREGTDFARCRLMIEETQLMIHCPKCATDQPALSIQKMVCAVCGTASSDIVSGRELELFAMEMSE